MYYLPLFSECISVVDPDMFCLPDLELTFFKASGYHCIKNANFSYFEHVFWFNLTHIFAKICSIRTIFESCFHSSVYGQRRTRIPVLLIRSFLPKVDNQLNELRKYSMCTLNHSRWICLVKLYCTIVSKKTTIVYLLFCVYIYLLNLLTALFVIPTVLYVPRAEL